MKLLQGSINKMIIKLNTKNLNFWLVYEDPCTGCIWFQNKQILNSGLQIKEIFQKY